MSTLSSHGWLKELNGTLVARSVFLSRFFWFLVLHAWAERAKTLWGAPQKAEELMKLQMQLVDSNVLPRSANPDIQTYSIVMIAWANSQNGDKVHQTYRLLQELMQDISEKRLGRKTNLVVAFTAVLDAAAHPPVKQSTEPTTDANNSPFGAVDEVDETPLHSSSGDEYTIALQAYRELKDDIYGLGCKADHHVFAKMIQVIGIHTDATSAERRQMLQLIFDDACAAGEVSKLVVKYLAKVCPDKGFLVSLLENEELADGDLHSVDDLPRRWTRNVPGPFRQFKRVDAKKRRFNKR